MKIKQKLNELGIKPVEGQNFLNSENIVKALVESGEVDGKTVLEIGAGTGVITEKLVERSEKVYAVETDTTLSSHLEKRFSDKEVEVVNEDYLKYDTPEEVERCVSNLPFHISSEAIKKLGEEQIQSSLILQKELAEKLVSEPGEKRYSPLTVVANYYFVPVKLRDVSKRNYYPKPEVETSIVKLYPNKDRHGVEDEDFFFKVSDALFTHKRKKVRNAFVDARHIFEIEKDEAKEIRDSIPYSEIRVVKLDVRKMAEITSFLMEEDIE